MEFLQANWIWILVALGVVWLLTRRGGMGCGMGGHRSSGQDASRGETPSSPARPSDQETVGHEGQHAAPRGRTRHRC